MLKKKIYYGIVLFLQLICILITVINIIYNLITNTHDIFTGSIVLLFLPYYRIITEQSIWHIFPLILLFSLSIVLLIKSSIELFDDNNISSPFTVCNILWFLISDFFCIGITSLIKGVDDNTFPFYSDENAYIVFPYIIMSILMIIMLFVKWITQNNMCINNTLQKNHDTLGKFQLDSTGYSQIKRTAKGSCVVSILCIFINFLLSYLYCNNVKIILFLHSISFVFIAIILISTIVECRKLQSKNVEVLPTRNFIKKLYISQFLSFVILFLSLVLFISKA